MTKKFLNLRSVIAIAICLAVTTMFSSCDSEVENPDCPDDPIEVPIYDPVRERFEAVKVRLEQADERIEEIRTFVFGNENTRNNRISADGRTLPEIIAEHLADSTRQADEFRPGFFHYEEMVDYHHMQPGLVRQQMMDISQSMGIRFTNIIDTTTTLRHGFINQLMVPDASLWRQINEFHTTVSHLINLRMSPEQLMSHIEMINGVRDYFVDRLNDVKNRSDGLASMDAFYDEVARLEQIIQNLESKIERAWSYIEIILEAGENATNP